MLRRDFVGGVGSAAAWPLAAQPVLPLIGFLGSGQNDNVTLPAILQGLREAGFVEGRNVNIEYRWAEGRYDRLPALATDLVNQRVAVICASGGLLPAVGAKAGSTTIPIGFSGV